MTDPRLEATGLADAGARPRTSDALLRYAAAPLALGVRRALGQDALEAPRSELVARLKTVFAGAEELKGALEEGFEQALQLLTIGLKAPWLMVETGETDYCATFAASILEPFKQDQGLEGRLLLDFLDGFFLDYDTALDAMPKILGLADLDDDAFFGIFLDAGDPVAHGNDAAAWAASATTALRESFVRDVGLEEEHPIVRLGSWYDLFADALLVSFAEAAKTHPSWYLYTDLLEEEHLARQDARAAAAKDDAERARVALARGLNERVRAFRERFGAIVENRAWLFDLADRLEAMGDVADSELAQKPVGVHDLPGLLKAALEKIHTAQHTSRVVRPADALEEPRQAVIEALRRARKDFRRSHWMGDGYGESALLLGAAMFPSYGPRSCERYFREAIAFGADPAAARYGLYVCALANGEPKAALEHLRASAAEDPERFEPFDSQRYSASRILGAGTTGVSFLTTAQDGRECVVKSLWDEIGTADPRPSLRALETLARARIDGVAKLLHLGLHKKQRVYVVTEFVPGEDLEGYRESQGGEAGAQVVADIGAKAARVLGRAHAAGVVHRNLRPGNVRVGTGEDGSLSVTLLDFAIPSYLLSPPERVRGVRRLAAWSRLGRATAEDLASYAAPEMLKGGIAAATPASDVYGLGATLYRFATGGSPRKLDPNALPSSLRDVLVRCLDRSPENRPASAEELARALDEAKAAAAAAPSQPARPPFSLTESQEAEFGLGGLELGGAEGIDDLDPFGAAPPAAAEPEPALRRGPTAPYDDPFAAAPPGQDPFAAAADPFGALTIGVPPPAAPAADPFALGAPPSDPFGAPPGADPFGGAAVAAPPPPAPGAQDPFAPSGSDPFGTPGLDPFGAATIAHPGPSAPGTADPFAPAAADPFTGTSGLDPFGAATIAHPGPSAPGAADPFAPAATDPFGAATLGAPPPAALDPFAAAAPGAVAFGSDPFGAAAPPAAPFGAPPDFGAPTTDGALTMTAPVPDPFADPFGAGAGAAVAPPPAAPFAAADPFAGGAALEPPPAAPPQDPFGVTMADPFAAPPPPAPGAPGMGPPEEGWTDAGVALLDPFAQGSVELAPPSGVAPPPAAPAKGPGEPQELDPNEALALLDSLLLTKPKGAGKPSGAKPPAGKKKPAAGKKAPVAAAPPPTDLGALPELPATPAADLESLPDLPATPGAVPGPPPAIVPVVSTLEPEANELAAPEPPRVSKRLARPDPAASAPKEDAKGDRLKALGKKLRSKDRDGEAKVDEEGYGLVISGLALKSKKEAAIQILVDERGLSREEAYELCRSPVVPVLKRVKKQEADTLAEKFRAAKINVRVTERKERG